MSAAVSLTPEDLLRLEQRREAFVFEPPSSEDTQGQADALTASRETAVEQTPCSQPEPPVVTNKVPKASPPVVPPVMNAGAGKPNTRPVMPTAAKKILPTDSLRRLVNKQLTTRVTTTPPSLERIQRVKQAASTPVAAAQAVHVPGEDNPYDDNEFSQSNEDWDELEQLIGSVDWDTLDSLHSSQVKYERVINKDLDAIVPPLGIEASSLSSTRSFCGQPEWALTGPDDSVPKGSYYDGWIWNAAGRQAQDSTLVEIYVSAQNEYGPKRTQSTRKDGTEVEGTLIEPLAPVFSYDHHALLPIAKDPSAPWGLADRVLLIPVTFKPVLSKKKGYSGYTAPPQTNYYPDIVAATPMLHGQDTTAHAVHGRCALSFTGPDGHESYAEYWVVLSKEELQRRHSQWGSVLLNDSVAETMASGALSKAEKDLLTERFELRPNERFLGSFVSKGAQYLYEQAKAGRGIVMPDDWEKDEVDRLQSRHKGIAEQQEIEQQRAHVNQHITPTIVRS